MPRHLPVLLALALCAALLCAGLALAASPPPALEGADIEAAAKAASANPLPSMNPIAVVKAMNQSIRASDQQNQAAVDALNQAQAKSNPTQGGPASKAGGGKVIYGDIIIHK